MDMKASTLRGHRRRINLVADRLAYSLDEPLEPKSWARLAGLSDRQLERVFKRTIGESLRAYVLRLRLERAAVRLRATRTGILTLALDAGFQSHEAFTRAFRQRFGHTPQNYRRMACVTGQPRAREQLWRMVAEGGLRRHAEK